MVGVMVGGARVGSGVSVGRGVSLGNGVSGTTSLAGGSGVSVDGERAVGALIDETARYCGRLESYLANSEYWASAPLMHRVELLLFLIDRGMIERRLTARGYQCRAIGEAEEILIQQSELRPYLLLTLELIAAVRLASRPRRSKV